jgi:hypothetical protein
MPPLPVLGEITSQLRTAVHHARPKPFDCCDHCSRSGYDNQHGDDRLARKFCISRGSRSVSVNLFEKRSRRQIRRRGQRPSGERDGAAESQSTNALGSSTNLANLSGTCPKCESCTARAADADTETHIENIEGTRCSPRALRRGRCQADIGGSTRLSKAEALMRKT